MEWIERMDVTVAKDQLIIKGLENKQGEELSKELIDNDFKREGLFLKQAEAAVNRSLSLLEKHGVVTRRAEDYFAQMAKSDDHMKRVRETLLSKHAEMEKREKVRKLREMKKMGKQIQVEVEKKKLQAKKKMNESLKKFKKSGDKDDLDIALEDDDEKSKLIRNRSKDRDERGGNKKRRNDDEEVDSKKKK
jgi:rRNA-processing protein EBP2